MLTFACDYGEGAHEKILERLVETNRESLPGYGADHYCESAKEKIRTACNCPEADVFFLVGGTQTNEVVIDALLSPHEGVVAAGTGHISVHEAGAIERTGHKVLTLPEQEGKLVPAVLAAFLRGFWEDANHTHMVFPGMVYISHPTEYGTLYTKKELEELSAVCRQFQIPLYMDGARLGYGLAASHTDVTLQTVADTCDVFYIGGTKVGALCGEAVVFPRGNMPHCFLTLAKQHGALLAKGRLLGIQFDTLFTDDLYLEISRRAIAMAERMKEGLRARSCSFYLDSPTNQQFIILEDEVLAQLKERVTVSFWEKADEGHTVVRLATSWATEEKDIEELMAILDEIRGVSRK